VVYVSVSLNITTYKNWPRTAEFSKSILQRYHEVHEARTGAPRITGITPLGVNLTLRMEMFAMPITPVPDKVYKPPPAMQRQGHEFWSGYV